MTDTVTIYHNPRCSKSRATLELLGAQGIQPRVIEYLDTPPDAATLDQLLELLGLDDVLGLGGGIPARLETEIQGRQVAGPGEDDEAHFKAAWCQVDLDPFGW